LKVKFQKSGDPHTGEWPLTRNHGSTLAGNYFHPDRERGKGGEGSVGKGTPGCTHPLKIMATPLNWVLKNLGFVSFFVKKPETPQNSKFRFIGFIFLLCNLINKVELMLIVFVCCSLHKDIK